ncbi:MAG: polysaccharide deacetylase family protein [Candidatus Riflebacteria bacterium]|nr:polysaccharide deacetylase family protein [Candidatus Riflebacteria bacterium]
MSKKSRFCFLLLIIALTGIFPGKFALFADVRDPSVPPDILRDFEHLRVLYQNNPRDIPTINALGILYAKVQQTDQAILLWKMGLNIDPTYVHFYNNIGSALKAQKKYSEARQVYYQGLKLAPSYWIYYNLGILDWELGQWGEAARNFEACVKLNPGFEPAKIKLREMGFPVPESVSPPPGRLGENLNLALEPKPPVSIAGLVDNLPESQSVAPAEEEDDPSQPAIEEPDPESERPGPHGTSGSDSRKIPTERVLPPSYATIDSIAESARKSIKPSEPKVVALTFDDGPHPTLTPQLLDFLKKENVAATFFVIGSRAEVYPDMLIRMVAERHEIGNHGWTHRSLVNLGSSKASAELEKTAQLVGALTGKMPSLVRPPFGHTNSSIENMIHKNGWHQIMWDADSRDWQNGSTSQIIRRVMKDLKPRGIILFHDIHPGALRALPILIPALKKAGFRFVTVSELIGIMQAAS